MTFIRRLLGRGESTPPAQKGFPIVYPLMSSGWQGAIDARPDLPRENWGAAQSYQLVIPVRRAVDLIAQRIAELDWDIVYNPTNDPQNDKIIASSRDIRKIYTAPIARAMMEAERKDNMPLFQTMMYDYLLFGEVYIEKVRNEGRVPSGVKRLNPLGMSISQMGGEIVSYTWSWDGALTSTLHPDDVAYLHNYNPVRDNFGLGLTEAGMDQINISRNLQRYVRAFYINNARPGIILSPDNSDMGWTDNDVEGMRMQLRDFFQGVTQSHQALIAKRPLSAVTLENSDISAQYSLDEAVTRAIFMLFGVPIAMAGDSSASTYKDGDEVYWAFMMNAIKPRVRIIERFMNLHIATFFDASGSTRLVFDETPFERLGQEALNRASAATQLYQSQLVTLNEAREVAKFEPVENGDTFYTMPQDMGLGMLSGMLPQEPQEEPMRRYDDMDFKPTEGMVEEAQRGLDWRSEYGRGGTEVGIARARDIVNRKNLSPDTVRRMKAYFDRHEVDKQGEGWSPDEDGFPSNGRIAWALWGGDAGQSWSSRMVARMNREDEGKSYECDCEACQAHTEPELDWVGEWRAWRKFALKGSHHKRAFRPNVFDKQTADYMQAVLEQCTDKSQIQFAFDTLHSYTTRYGLAGVAVRLAGSDLLSEDDLADLIELLEDVGI